MTNKADKEVSDYIERLFVHDVREIRELVTTPGHYARMHLSAILRRLIIDGAGLAHLANRAYRLQLLVLVPEPESGNTPIDELPTPTNLQLKYAPDISERSMPPGCYLKPYKLNTYLDRPIGVLFRRAITAREIIVLVANKLGGVHIDPDYPSDGLYQISKHVHIFGQEAVYQFFDSVASNIWRALMPLHDTIVDAHGGTCELL